MATHGILGVTTETSVNFVWYFILFGVVYSASRMLEDGVRAYADWLRANPDLLQ